MRKKECYSHFSHNNNVSINYYVTLCACVFESTTKMIINMIMQHSNMNKQHDKLTHGGVKCANTCSACDICMRHTVEQHVLYVTTF